MKRILLIAAVFAACSSRLQAQDFSGPQTTASVAGDAVRRGNWLAGASIGDTGFNFSSERFNLDINPRAGYFISDNAVVGAQLRLGTTIFSGENLYRYGLTPFVRYYFPEGAAAAHRWFGEAVVGYERSTRPGDEDAVDSRVYGISGGYAHFVASNVALEGMINLLRSNPDVDVGNSETRLSFSLGLQIYLPGKHKP